MTKKIYTESCIEYEGEYKNGRSRYGKSQDPITRERYEGYWERGMRNGKGTFYKATTIP